MNGELPSSAADVRLSRTGSLLLLSAFTAAYSLFDVKTAMPPMKIFPDYAAILESFIGDESMNGIGLETASFADAVIFLGLFISDTSIYTAPKDDQTFTGTLQRVSLLSANSPSAPLRFNAHLLTTKILHSHPSDDTRLAFIQDTLQYCPYENLKTSAVGWLKDEILSADRSDSVGPSHSAPFRSPSTLSTLSPFLFLDPRKLNLSNDYSSFHSHYSFYLAVLNLLYLLLTSPSLYLLLNIKSFIQTSNIRLGFLDPLKQISDQLKAQSNQPNENEEGEDEAAGGAVIREEEREREEEEEETVVATEIVLLDGSLEMVEKALKDKGI